MGHKKRQLHPHHGSPLGREHWQAIASSHWFQFISVSTIIINGLLIGIEQHFDVEYLLNDVLHAEGVVHSVPHEIDKTAFRAMDLIFIVFWSGEICLNALAQGSHFYELKNP